MQRESKWHPISEKLFRISLEGLLRNNVQEKYDFVTGPGRSGAIASVYTSHILGIPYIPHKAGGYDKFESVLVVDTVRYTGKTLRKAATWYGKRGLQVKTFYVFPETHRHYFKFWYEK